MGLASILCAIEESSSLKRKDIPSLFNLPLPAFWKKVMVEVASSHGGKCHDDMSNQTSADSFSF